MQWGEALPKGCCPPAGQSLSTQASTTHRLAADGFVVLDDAHALQRHEAAVGVGVHHFPAHLLNAPPASCRGAANAIRLQRAHQAGGRFAVLCSSADCGVHTQVGWQVSTQKRGCQQTVPPQTAHLARCRRLGRRRHLAAEAVQLPVQLQGKHPQSTGVGELRGGAGSRLGGTEADLSAHLSHRGTQLIARQLSHTLLHHKASWLSADDSDQGRAQANMPRPAST